MSFRFRKSIRLAKGVRLNLSKGGVGLGVGGKGLPPAARRPFSI